MSAAPRALVLPKRGRTLRTPRPAALPAPPEPVPRSRGEAAAAALVLAGVFVALVFVLAYSLDAWRGEDVPGRLFAGAIAVGTAFTLVCYLVALGWFVLPTLFGLRPPRGVRKVP